MTAYGDLVAWLTDTGFRRSRSADKFGHEVWARKGVSVRVNGTCSAVAAEEIRVKAEHDMAVVKRKPKTARARITAEKRSAADQKRRAELEARIAARNRELGGAREVLTTREARQIIRQIESDERELHRLQALMTQVPRQDAGRPMARHHS